MDQRFITTLRSPAAARMGRAFTWLAWIVCYGFLLAVIVSITHQIVVPPRAQRVILLRGIPLPEGLKARGAPDSLDDGAVGIVEECSEREAHRSRDD